MAQVKKQNAKISVIVPIYNTEKYLKRCVDSILAQTYDNLEIILIDDGSFDKCSQICDEYVKNDKRIKVVHKKNGGPSESRNMGLDIAEGKYVVFVDSDDCIPENSLEILLDALNATDSQIASGHIKDVYMYRNNRMQKKKPIVFETEEALKNLMYLHGFSNSASSKLYEKKLFNGIRYPVGKLYEDFATTYRIFAKAKKIALVENVAYYYFQNRNSIMHTKYSMERLDGLRFAIEEEKFINDKYPEIINAARYRVFYECLLILNDMPFFHKDAKKVKRELRKRIKYVLKDKELSIKQKLLCYSIFFGRVGVKNAFMFKKVIKRF